MKPKLLYNAIVARMKLEIDALKGETRAEIILLQAHVEFMIDEIFEVLIESDKMRGTRSRLEKKLEILKDLGWFTEETVNDIKQLSKIRGLMAHSLDVYSQETREKMETEFKQIQLIKRADPVFFPKDDSIQKHLRNLMEIYMSTLYYVYENVYKLKQTRSLENPDSLRENWRFIKGEKGEPVMVKDEV